MSVHNKNALSGLYAITDPELMGDQLLQMSEAAIVGGVRILQYRNKNATIEQQKQEASALAQLCNQHAVTFLINDNVELALAVNADGVHLGQKDCQLQKARQQLGENKIIGITCNNQLEWAQQAQTQGADYVAFGRFFTSNTKPDAPQADKSLIAEAKKHLSIPVVAIGGITLENAATLLNQGADMLAVIHALFSSTDITETGKEFSHLFKPSVSP